MLTDKIYESDSMLKCAKKCYNEIKLNKISTDQFTIKDIDTSETFTFAVNKKYESQHQIGGQIEESKESNYLNTHLKSIDDRITTIEQKLKEDECVIM